MALPRLVYYGYVTTAVRQLKIRGGARLTGPLLLVTRTSVVENEADQVGFALVPAGRHIGSHKISPS